MHRCSTPSEATISKAHRLGMSASVDNAMHNMGTSSLLPPLTTWQYYHNCHHANVAVRPWQQYLKQQKQEEEKPQQVRQHLVDFQGRTLCVSALPKISCVVTAVLETLGVASEASARIEVPWRITFGGRFLGLTEDAPSSGSILRVWTGGLRGGKGGFGAMLRAMAKQAGAKPTTDFGACRDLQGRRLRHVNDEIRLQKWQEDRERENRGEKVEETKTPSGIEGWHLGVPTWAEGAKPSFMKTRRKTMLCQQWLDARKDRKAPEGAPPWWGCPRGRGCDFAHGKEELRGKGLEEFTKKQQKETREKRQLGLDKYLQSSSAEEVTRDMSSAVCQGLKAEVKAGLKRAAEQAEEARGLLRMDLQGGEAGMEFPGCSWMDVCGGDVELTEEGTAKGASEFGTVRVVGVALRKKKWYLEVRLLTAGLMQIGWADHTFVPGGPESGDGIGDVKGSWAYDGVRRQRWNEEQSDYGESWQAGDIVGCLLEIDASSQTASMRFTLNGKDMGVAFHGVELAPPTESYTEEMGPKDDPGFFPAFSLEKGEAVTVNLGQSAFVHPPPEGFKAVIEARPGGIAAPQPRPDDAGGEGAGKGEDREEYPRAPIDLEQFSCATDLAERFGPNRLKEELMSRGVKCGGTHYQRAARLFSLKSLAPEDYPKEVLAKKAKR